MGIPTANAGKARKIQVTLLALAWVMALVSLPGPAEDTPVILMLFRIPVYLLVGDAFVAPIEAQTRFMAWIALAALLFILSPMSLARRMSRKRLNLHGILSVGLLGAWAFPIVVEWVASLPEKQRWGFQHVAWGYYLYASAHTIAFIAVQIGSWAGPPKVDNRRGFPVLPRSGGES